MDIRLSDWTFVTATPTKDSSGKPNNLKKVACAPALRVFINGRWGEVYRTSSELTGVATGGVFRTAAHNITLDGEPSAAAAAHAKANGYKADAMTAWTMANPKKVAAASKETPLPEATADGQAEAGQATAPPKKKVAAGTTTGGSTTATGTAPGGGTATATGSDPGVEEFLATVSDSHETTVQGGKPSAGPKPGLITFGAPATINDEIAPFQVYDVIFINDAQKAQPPGLGLRLKCRIGSPAAKHTHTSRIVGVNDEYFVDGRGQRFKVQFFNPVWAGSVRNRTGFESYDGSVAATLERLGGGDPSKAHPATRPGTATLPLSGGNGQHKGSAGPRLKSSGPAGGLDPNNMLDPEETAADPSAPDSEPPTKHPKRVAPRTGGRKKKKKGGIAWYWWVVFPVGCYLWYQHRRAAKQAEPTNVTPVSESEDGS